MSVSRPLAATANL